ncbi:MAG: hypothetical protein FJ218_10400 [Ignavibacteria bacterium]|nr:hypothetical protein [Ignavibacteria bacterium]
MKEQEKIIIQLRHSLDGDAWHGPSLLELLSDVNAERAYAKPISSAHSIREIVLHILTWIRVVRKRMDGIICEPTNEENWQGVVDTSEQSWKQTLLDVKTANETLCERISQLNDEALEQNIEGKNYTLYTMLHGVVQHTIYHAGQIALLKKAKRKIDTVTIFNAVENSDIEKVQELLRNDSSLVHSLGGYQKTPLHFAAENNRKEIAQLLIDVGANLEAETSWGMTPLAWAVNCGNNDVAELLLSQGATTNLWISSGFGNLDSVKSFFHADNSLKHESAQSRVGKNEIGDWMKLPPSEVEHEIISDAFYIACRNGNVDVADYLLAKGADINFRGFFGATGLHWACINGHTRIVKFLLQLNANVSLIDEEFQSTPLEWAREGKNEEILVLLEQYLAQHQPIKETNP